MAQSVPTSILNRWRRIAAFFLPAAIGLTGSGYGRTVYQPSPHESGQEHRCKTAAIRPAPVRPRTSQMNCSQRERTAPENSAPGGATYYLNVPPYSPFPARSQKTGPSRAANYPPYGYPFLQQQEQRPGEIGFYQSGYVNYSTSPFTGYYGWYGNLSP
jgi:hypothetical protein